jgi:hypothetical protein
MGLFSLKYTKMMPIGMPKIIESAATKRQSEREVASGILNSGMLTGFQKTALDGIIVSAMPKYQDKGTEKIRKVKPAATKVDVGMGKYQGSKYA